MSLFGTKSPFKSLTVWGSVLSLVSCLEALQEALQLLPVHLLPPKTAAAVTAAGGIIGSVLAIIGRFKAKKALAL